MFYWYEANVCFTNLFCKSNLPYVEWWIAPVNIQVGIAWNVVKVFDGNIELIGHFSKYTALTCMLQSGKDSLFLKIIYFIRVGICTQAQISVAKLCLALKCADNRLLWTTSWVTKILITVLTIFPVWTIQRRIHFWVLESCCCLKFWGQKNMYECKATQKKKLFNLKNTWLILS